VTKKEPKAVEVGHSIVARLAQKIAQLKPKAKTSSHVSVAAQSALNHMKTQTRLNNVSRLEHQHDVAVALEHKIQAAADKAVNSMKKKDKYMLTKVAKRDSAIKEELEVRHAGAAIVTHAFKAKADKALTKIKKLDRHAKKFHKKINEVVKVNSEAQVKASSDKAWKQKVQVLQEKLAKSQRAANKRIENERRL